MSIEALNWARKIYVGDAYGKSVLRAIADYADEVGHCFPSLSRLADDCDLSIDSVRRRVKLLEEAGIIVTFRCWMDENGKRNHEGRGRETSRDIRLPLDLVRTRETIEQNAEQSAGDDDDDVANADTPLANSKGGLADGEGSQQPGADSQSCEGRDSSRASPPLAVVPPLEPSSNLHSNKNPQAPLQGAVGLASQDEGQKTDEPEHFAPFFESCQHWRTMDRGRALLAFSMLTGDEQLKARAGSPSHAAECDQAKRKSKDAHKLIAERFWERYPNARLPEKPVAPHFEAEGSPPWRARNVMAAIAGEPKLVARWCGEERGEMFRYELTPAHLALQAFDGENPDEWQLVEAGTNQCGAWRTFLSCEARQITVAYRQSPLDPSRHDWPVKKEGLRVPIEWPPKKDGTIYASATTPKMRDTCS